MKVLVTGGAGFIGSNFLFYMQKAHPDYYIICVDKLTYAGCFSTIAPLMEKPNFKFFKADICDRKKIYEIFEKEKPEMVVNFAAESHVDRSIKNPEIFIRTNIEGTAVLMDACKKFNVKRFHQVSTDEVYGELPLQEKNLYFTEDTPIKASSPYSASKAGADLLVQAYFRTYHLPVTISRCSNNYGPYQFPEKLIPLMIIKATMREKLPVYGRGENVRDWLHVSDHCRAIDLILHNGKMGEVYNVGGHNEKTNLEIVRKILNTFKIPESQITFVKDRPGHDLRYAIDAKKIKTELGWEPKILVEEGLDDTINWYIKNEQWWCRIRSGEYLSDYM